MSVKGKNSEIVYNNERYHIQTESWFPEEKALVTQIFKGGQVVLKKKFKSDVTEGDFSDAEIADAHTVAVEELKALLI